MPVPFPKTPAEVIDYDFDFANPNDSTDDVLEANETINSYTLAADPGITIEADQLINSSTKILFWARGGDLLKKYTVTATVITSESRIIQRSLRIRMVPRKFY